jgi:hypothetical protein
LKHRYQKMQRFMTDPHSVQSQVLSTILKNNTSAAYAQQYRLQLSKELPSHLPPVTYEELKPYID